MCVCVCVCVCVYVCMYVSFYLSISIYIYIYISVSGPITAALLSPFLPIGRSGPDGNQPGYYIGEDWGVRGVVREPGKGVPELSRAGGAGTGGCLYMLCMYGCMDVWIDVCICMYVCLCFYKYEFI